MWLAGCGDGAVIISFNSGFIVGDPRCDGSGGQFDFHDEAGLIVLVIITERTDIIIDSGPGRCADLSSGTLADVSGSRRGNRIVAASITAR